MCHTGYYRYSLPFPCIPREAAMAAAFSLLSAACALRWPPRSSAGGSIGWGAHHSPDPTARHGRRLLLGAALLATAAPASDAFVEGVCVDGQLKWAAYRAGTGPKPAEWCEELPYNERPAFKAIPPAQVERLAAEAEAAADADAFLRQRFQKRAAKLKAQKGIWPGAGSREGGAKYVLRPGETCPMADEALCVTVSAAQRIRVEDSAAGDVSSDGAGTP